VATGHTDARTTSLGVMTAVSVGSYTQHTDVMVRGRGGGGGESGSSHPSLTLPLVVQVTCLHKFILHFTL
jgi:hypothetical protein